MRALLLLFLSVTAQADFEIDYSTRGSEPVMRQETVYRKGIAGIRQAFQTRVYVDGSNELKEAAFLQQNGRWARYSSAELPGALKAQIDFVNKSGPRRVQAYSHPPVVLDNSLKAGEVGKPVLLVIPETGAQSARATLACEASSPGFVICNGVTYKGRRWPR